MRIKKAVAASWHDIGVGGPKSRVELEREAGVGHEGILPLEVALGQNKSKSYS